jgi:hypothetical protein
LTPSTAFEVSQMPASAVHSSADSRLELGAGAAIGASVTRGAEGEDVRDSARIQPFTTISITRTRSRSIPAQIKQAVWLRDGGCCSFVYPDGKRCNSKFAIELDHAKPFAKGGDHSVNNLRLCCQVHNALYAVREFGFRKRPSTSG